MIMTTVEKLKLIMDRKNITMAQLADATGQTRQNLSNKLAREKERPGSFSERELRSIADALGCKLMIEVSE